MATVKATIDGVDSTVENITDSAGTVLATLSAALNLQVKSVTANGDVTPDSGYDGLSKVSVNVSGGGSSGGASGALTVSDTTTHTVTINTGLDEVKALTLAYAIDATASAGVRVTSMIIIDFVNTLVWYFTSNASGTTLITGVKTYTTLPNASITATQSNGTVTLTTPSSSEVFNNSVYRWYAA